jgi:hypothetical protein
MVQHGPRNILFFLLMLFLKRQTTTKTRKEDLHIKTRKKWTNRHQVFYESGMQNLV